jgi:acetyl-CoA carboxylase biotin carboxyl carrier protein
MTKDRNEADVAFIQALAELLSKNELTELEVKREYGEADRLNVRVSRQQHIVTHQMSAPMQMAAPQAAPAPHAPGAPVVATPNSDPASLPGALTSPMVGTVYLSAEPGAEPFVKVGDRVAEGQTVLIIEAMKTMNQIPANKAGTVKRIVVGDASPVEFGTPLLIIE